MTFDLPPEEFLRSAPPSFDNHLHYYSLVLLLVEERRADLSSTVSDIRPQDGLMCPSVVSNARYRHGPENRYQALG